ncbi:MAG: hypothetical protein R3E96_03310 [Planctomycetota bacterium]
MRDEEGALKAIVEHKDADADEPRSPRRTPVYAFDGHALLRNLPRLSTNNAQGAPT